MKQRPNRPSRNRARRVRAAAVQALEPLESRQLMTGTVQATLTLDANANGAVDAGEPRLQGWTVYVDYNRSGTLDAGEPSGVSGADGRVTLGNVNAGTWDVREVVPAGYAPAAGFKDFDRASIRDGKTDTITFLNVASATGGAIQGTVWNDVDGNGVRDLSDPGIPGWTVYVDVNQNRVLDAGDVSTTTDTGGAFTFTNLAPGKYDVREIQSSGWDSTVGADAKVSATVAAGGTATVSFGNFNAAGLGAIRGTVWNDVNADGFRAAGDPGLGGWTVFLDLNSDGAMTAGEPSTVTDASGVYSFPSVTVGTYRVAEVLQSGWNLSPGHPQGVTVTVANEDPGVADFANFTPTLGSIGGRVWNDADGNGSVGAGEAGLAGWTVFIDQDNDGLLGAGEPSAVSDAAGNYTIAGVPVGSFVVRDVPATAGWTATAPGTGMQLVTVLNASVATGVNFGNKQRADSSISGTVFVDANGNGVRDAGEKGLSGVTVYLDLNDNGVQDAGEPAATSSADLFYTPAVNEAGAYQFTHLPEGTYHVREVVPDLLSATPAANRSLAVSLAAGGAVVGADFADVYRANEIHGAVFDDANHNHVRDAGEAGIGGVTVYVDANRNNLADPGEPTTVTAADGSYAFTTNLGPGSYVVRALHFSGREDTYPTTTAGILWPAGVSNPAVGNVSPTAITTSLAEGQAEHRTVSLTLPPGGSSLTNMVDVFLLFDDTGSFTSNSPIVRAAFPQIIAALQAAMPGVDFGFGVGRFEEYANFASENAAGRPFILNQPIIGQSTPGFSLAIQSALDRTAPGYGGDQPETDIEALYQVATGAGFDGNDNGTTGDSGAAGLVNTQVNPGASGDVPAFGSFTVDAAGNVLPPAGNVGGAGFRTGAMPIILVATDTGFAFQPMGETSITGVGGVTLPISALTGTSRPSTPFNSGAGIQQTVDALNALGALVIGLGTNGTPTADPRQGLEALATLTGAVNHSAATIPNGTLTPIAPGAPLYFEIASGFGASVANGIVTAVENAVSAVSVNLTLKASDPRVHIISTPGVINGVGSGQTATFDVVFTGDGRPHRFDLQFVRQGTDVVLGSIPVVIGTPIAGEGYEYVELEDGEIQHAEDFGDWYNPLLPVNVAPSFTKGADQSVAPGSGTQTVVGWASGISAGSASDAGQVVNFLVSTDNGGLFSVQPTISADGTLTYTPAAGATGTATVTVRLHDSGGSVGGGDDTSAAQTFTITIAPVTLALPGTAGDDAYEVRVEGGRVKVYAGGGAGAALIYDVARGGVAGVSFDGGAGTDTLRLVGAAGVADDVTIGAAGATLGGAPITFNGVDTITFDGRGGDDVLTVTGGPTVTLAGGQRLAALAVDGGRVALAQGSGEAVVTRSLSITGPGRLDVADGALLVDYDAGTTSPAEAVRAALLAGRNGGSWDGTGITSSVAVSTTNMAVAYAEAAMLGLSTFAGQPVDASALVVRQARAGDANLDGKTTADDYALADRGKARGLGTWVFGDFDYDGAVTQADYDILNGEASGASTPAPAVPPAEVLVSASVAPVVAPVTAPAAPSATEPPAPAPSPTAIVAGTAKTPATKTGGKGKAALPRGHAKAAHKPAAKPARKTSPKPTTPAHHLASHRPIFSTMAIRW